MCRMLPHLLLLPLLLLLGICPAAVLSVAAAARSKDEMYSVQGHNTNVISNETAYGNSRMLAPRRGVPVSQSRAPSSFQPTRPISNHQSSYLPSSGRGGEQKVHWSTPSSSRHAGYLQKRDLGRFFLAVLFLLVLRLFGPIEITVRCSDSSSGSPSSFGRVVSFGQCPGFDATTFPAPVCNCTCLAPSTVSGNVIIFHRIRVFRRKSSKKGMQCPLRIQGSKTKSPRNLHNAHDLLKECILGMVIVPTPSHRFIRLLRLVRFNKVSIKVLEPVAWLGSGCVGTVDERIEETPAQPLHHAKTVDGPVRSGDGNFGGQGRVQGSGVPASQFHGLSFPRQRALHAKRGTED